MAQNNENQTPIEALAEMMRGKKNQTFDKQVVEKDNNARKKKAIPDPKTIANEEAPLEAFIKGSAAAAEYTDNPESFAKAARKKCFGLAKAWHISAVVLALTFIICGIVVASTTENGLTFFVYLIAAFFAYMISETIAAVINWLVSKK